MPLALAAGYIAISLIGICTTLSVAATARDNARLALESEKAATASLVKLRDISVRQAIGETLTGNAHRATVAIDNAYAAGVQGGWINVLQGLNHFLQGKYEKSKAPLQKASLSSDRSVKLCARSVLACSHVHVGDDEQYLDDMQYIRSQQPTNSHERVFVALAESMSDPLRVRQLLDGEQATIEYPIALAILGGERSLMATAATDVEEMRRSLWEIDNAIQFAGPAQHLLHAKTLAIRNTCELFRKTRQQLELASYQAELRSLMSDLDRKVLVNRCALMNCHAFLGEMSDFRELVAQTDFADSVIIEYAAAPLFEHAINPKLALKEFNEMRMNMANPNAIVAKAPFLAEAIDDEARFTELGNLYEQIISSSSHRIQARYRALSILALQGDAKRMRKEAESIRNMQNQTGVSTWGVGESLRVLRGEWNETDVKSAESPLVRCSGYHTLGLEAMAEGRKDDARRYFQECLDTGVHTFFEYHWSSAFLNRMQRNPNWPDWIPDASEPSL